MACGEITQPDTEQSNGFNINMKLFEAGQGYHFFNDFFFSNRGNKMGNHRQKDQKSGCKKNQTKKHNFFNLHIKRPVQRLINNQ